MKKFFSLSAGQSLIELILAIALLAIIGVNVLVVTIGSFRTTQLAEEEYQATLIAAEGLEAVESIRNQAWANLQNGDFGLSQSGGVWNFQGSSDTDASGKYIRVINITDGQRDTNNNLVSSGGTLDEATKVIIATVSWNFSPSRQNQITLNTILTNWLSVKGGEGIIVPTPP